MARNKSPQTFQKRMRERDRQMIQRAKLAKRLERKAAKRQGKLDGVTKTEAPPLVISPETPTPAVSQDQPLHTPRTQ